MKDRTVRKSLTVALVAIKPKYAELILSGEKTIDLRRVFNPLVNKIYLYSSSPAKKIVAVCDVELKRGLTHPSGSCVSSDKYYEYTKLGVIWHIKIKSVRPISATLADIGLKRPPQSYMFLSDKQIKILEGSDE